MTQQQIQQARDSLERCVADPSFLDTFYDLFLASSPDVKEKFKNTDFENQKRMLRSSLYVMMTAAGTTRGIAHSELERIARKHSRNDRDIKPELYSLWLECLLKAVARHDPEHTPELETAWREAVKDGIEFIQSRY